jgi:hypothetical protein
MVRLAVAGGARVGARGALRLAGVAALEYIAYHSDPDVLAEHPGVDLLVARGGLSPALGLEASLDVGASVAVGAFARASLTDLAVFREGDADPATAGDETRARLILAGLFVDFRLR